jgi:hypothetical protein
LDDCSHKELLRAFGLPEHPLKNVSGSNRSRGEKAAQENSVDALDIDVCMADVEAQEVKWLIEPYIPLGKLTIVEGDPDEGKRFAMLSIATAVTKGFGLPFSEIAEAGNVIDPKKEHRRTIRLMKWTANRVSLGLVNVI